jgi:hypothetical protein
LGGNPLILVFVVQKLGDLGRKIPTSCARLGGVEDASVGQFPHENRDLFDAQRRPFT